jgi:hypothetical protein
MSTPVIYNGVTYNVPAFGDTGYAQGVGNMSAYWIALATGSLQQTGGLFSLTADANFGPNFGLLSKYYTSITVNPASTGQIRLAKTDTLDWRNNANSGDLPLGVNASDQLTFNGIPVGGGATSAITALTGDVTAAGPGSVPATLATVNGNVGSFTNANITVNAKGLITAASNGTSGGVSSFAKFGDTPITGAVTISEGANVSLTESGQNIQISVPAVGGNGAIQYDLAGAFTGSAALTWNLNDLILTTGAGNAHIELLTTTGTPFITLFKSTASQVASMEISSSTLILETNNLPTSINDLNDDGAGPASAALSIRSTTRGFLPPVLTTTQKNAISSPAEGLMVYDITLHKLAVWTGATWETVTST